MSVKVSTNNQAVPRSEVARVHALHAISSFPFSAVLRGQAERPEQKSSDLDVLVWMTRQVDALNEEITAFVEKNRIELERLQEIERDVKAMKRLLK